MPQGAQYIPGPGAKRPNPNLGAGFFWYTEGNTSYNALQIDVSHRFSQGLQFRANYTWSKDLDMNSALTGAQANNQPQMIMDRNDPGRDWGPSAYNVPHQANISGSYDLPFGKGKPWANNFGGFGNRLVSGWQLNTIVTLQVGFPIHAADRVESVGRRRHTKSRPPEPQSRIFWPGDSGQSESVVQSQRV